MSYSITDTDLIFTTNEREYVLKVKDMPDESRPREKLISQGAETLSLAELLSIIFNTGTVKEGVIEMSGRVIREYGEKSILAEKNPEKLVQELDIPIVKACQIVACGELGRRIFQKNDYGFTTIRSARDVFDYLRDMHTLPKEQLRGLYLNSHNRIIRDEVISIGSLTANIVHPREVFRPAIEYGAVAVVLAHNHPSGDIEPSTADKEITEQLIRAGKIIGIHLLDHVIITKNSFASIKANYGALHN